MRQGLEVTRESILEAASGIENVDELLAKLPGLEETLSRYQAAGLEERLREQSLLVREERVVASVTESIQPFEDLLQSLQQKLPIDRAFLTPESLEELPGKEILSDGNGILSRLSDQLEEAARQIQKAIDQARAETETTNSRWGERKAEVEANFQSILRELGSQPLMGKNLYIFGSLTRAIGLIIFASSAMFVGWAAFQYMTAQGDPQAQMKARNQMIGVGIAMVLGGFAGFAPGFFNDLILRPAGIGVDTATAICDDHLKTVINPRTGSFGATSGQVNDAVLEVQTRYPEECHYTNWNVAAADGQTFSAADNQCFSSEAGVLQWPRLLVAGSCTWGG